SSDLRRPRSSRRQPTCSSREPTGCASCSRPSSRSAVRFVDFLRAAVLLCAGAATALAAVTVLSAGRSEAGDILVLVIAGWWVVAALIGAWLGRQAETNSPIARLLASAKST